MPGAVPLNERQINPVSDIAYKDAQGKWRAGPDANPKYVDAGGNVDPSYAKQATSYRRTINLVKSIQRARGVDESEAFELKNQMVAELEQTDDKDERRRIWQKYGSP